MMEPRDAFGRKMQLSGLLALGLGALSLWISPPTVAAASPRENIEEFAQGKTAQGFRYLSGGVSLEERRSMEAKAGEYNLRLTFAAKSGQYIADVRLVIQDEKGNEIITTRTEGPWFFIDLPPGKYNIKAAFKGETREIRSLPVSKEKSVRRFFHWEVE